MKNMLMAQGLEGQNFVLPSSKPKLILENHSNTSFFHLHIIKPQWNNYYNSNDTDLFCYNYFILTNAANESLVGP